MAIALMINSLFPKQEMAIYHRSPYIPRIDAGDMRASPIKIRQ
jgi:hypothetical protein